MNITENSKITLTFGQLKKLLDESKQIKCKRCGCVGDDLIFDSENYYCPVCWTDLCREESELDEPEKKALSKIVTEDFDDDEEEENDEEDEYAYEDVVERLRRMLGELETTRGYIYFSYTKLDGTLRHAKAGYKFYVPSSRSIYRPEDIVTYYDVIKFGWRCCHEYQLTDQMPEWRKY